MQVLMRCLIGLCVGVCASAEPLLEGRVRLESGEPVVDAQVRLFDLTDLERGAVGRAMTDDTGYFALPLAALPGMALPERFELGANYPNPFNPSTIIPYQLVALSEVRLEVFNLLGQHLATLVDGERPAGFHTATWHATDAAGRAVGAGVYIYRMTVGTASQTGRMVLIDGQAGVAVAGATSDWLEASGSGGLAKEEVYGLIVEGSGLVYVDSSFRVEAGMAPVELVVSAGPHSAGKAADGALVSFPDANLRAAIARGTTTGVSLLTVANMKAFTHLDLEGKDIRDLTGLEFATNLESLLLSDNRVWDVSALGGLTNLIALELSGNNLTDVSALSGLTNLIDLYLSGNNLTDVSALGGLTNLGRLELNNNNFTDVSALSGLTNLYRLELSGNNLTDVSALSGLTGLRELYLNSNNLTDVSALSGLTNLEALWLSNNRIQYVSPLGGLTNLERLYLSFNRITDVSPLSGLTKLRKLELTGNRITDVSALRDLANLRQVDLRGNPLNVSSTNNHIPALKASRVIVLFDSSQGEAADYVPVTIPDARLRAAIEAALVKASGVPITVADMKALTQQLDGRGRSIRDLTGLEFATNLKFLWLDYNWITDVSALKGLTNLEVLRLNYNSITDVSPLKGLTKLKDLGLRRNPLSVSSVNDHIAALERRGVTVSFNLPLRESDFDIELVFLDDFTENQKWVIQYAARRWMSIIREDLPDYEFTQGWSGTCGDQSYRIPAGEQIDDLRIYIINQPNEFGSYWGGPRVVRTTPHLPVLGCMSVGGNWGVTLHEIGHVLGIGTFWNDRGFLQDPNGDPHFNGPRAIAAFNDAGGRDYADAKVPVEEGGGGALSHWRSSVFQGELMDWTYGLNGIGPLSAITIQALADLGYVVDVTQADPYTLPSAAAKASAKVAAHSTQAEPKPVVRHRHRQQQEPIYVVDPQGNIVRTLHR